MFLATVPREVISQLKPIIQGWGAKRLYHGCAQEFALQRSLVDLPMAHLAQDSSLLSAALGSYLAGERLDLSLSAEHQDSLAWLQPYMETPEGLVATIRILGDMAEAWCKRDGNSFYARLAGAYQTQFPALHEKVLEKLAKLTLRLEAFHAEDLLVFQSRWMLDQEGGFVWIQGMDLGGTFWKHLDALFDWRGRPSPEPLDAPSLASLLRNLEGRQAWAVVTQGPLAGEDAPARLRGRVQNTARGADFHIYAGGTDRKQVVVPHQNVTAPRIPRVKPEQLNEGGGRLAIQALSAGEFNGLRSMYLNERIRPGSVTAAYAVLFNGALLGVFAISTSMKGTPAGVEPPSVYLMSDFSVLAGHRRAAKLVVMAATSREARLLIERVTKRRIHSMVTTAFSQRPQSMKYRNVFRLLGRKDASPEDQAVGFKFALNYGGPIGEASLDEVLKRWEALKNEG